MTVHGVRAPPPTNPNVNQTNTTNDNQANTTNDNQTNTTNDNQANTTNDNQTAATTTTRTTKQTLQYLLKRFDEQLFAELKEVVGQELVLTSKVITEEITKEMNELKRSNAATIEQLNVKLNELEQSNTQLEEADIWSTLRYHLAAQPDEEPIVEEPESNDEWFN